MLHTEHIVGFLWSESKLVTSKNNRQVTYVKKKHCVFFDVNVI